MNQRLTIAFVALVAYVASIPLANYFIQHVGTQAFPGGPHTVPVGFGYSAPSGVLWIGLALVARDIVQLVLGKRWVLGAIVVGAALSGLVAPSALVFASVTAFALGELSDFLVYTPLAKRRLFVAVVASGIVGAVIDSVIFLQIAFGSTLFWQGNVIGKVWMSVLALPVVWLVRNVRLRTA